MRFTVNALFILIVAIYACKPGPNYVPSTIQAQAVSAGVVFEGVVTFSPSLFERNDHKVTVSNVSYYKSCGHSEVTVQNFRSSVACGVDFPKVGTKVIIFGCQSLGSADFDLNEINIHTGLVAWSETNVNQVKESLGIFQALPGDQCGDYIIQQCSNGRDWDKDTKWTSLIV